MGDGCDWSTGAVGGLGIRAGEGTGGPVSLAVGCIEAKTAEEALLLRQREDTMARQSKASAEAAEAVAQALLQKEREGIATQLVKNKAEAAEAAEAAVSAFAKQQEDEAYRNKVIEGASSQGGGMEKMKNPQARHPRREPPVEVLLTRSRVHGPGFRGPVRRQCVQCVGGEKSMVCVLGRPSDECIFQAHPRIQRCWQLGVHCQGESGPCSAHHVCSEFSHVLACVSCGVTRQFQTWGQQAGRKFEIQGGVCAWSRGGGFGLH